MENGSHVLRDPRPLVDALLAAGWRVIAPVVRDGALAPRPVACSADLPRGLSDEQAPGAYRLVRHRPDRWFDAVVGPEGWKRYLHPPEQRLWSATRSGDRFSIAAEPVDWTPTVLFGVRPCDVAAIWRQAEVFRQAGDTAYARRLEGTRIVAVNCVRSARTCFCASMDTGPRATAGIDLALTELDESFLVEIGTPEGKKLLEGMDLPPAPPDLATAARAATAANAATQTRVMPDGIAGTLQAAAESPRWAAIADRCLHCANCTLVCPTCFCTDLVERSDLSGDHVEHWQRWDSCFSTEFTHLHGGAVRRSAAARYRQWMTHKLSTWHDQFGSSGCTGCGRCIAWCPVGIDIVAEATAFVEDV